MLDLVCGALTFMLCGLTPFTADRVEIMREKGQNVFRLTGRVQITSDRTIISCREANLHDDEGWVELSDSVLIHDPDGEIQASRAEYRFSERIAYLSGGVKLIDSSRTIQADSLVYEGNKRQASMFRNVKIQDPTHNLTAAGQRGWFDLNHNIGNLTGQPWLEIERQDKTPMTLTALNFFLDTGNNQFFGYDSVIAHIDSFTIRADTFRYGLKSQEGSMVRPVITEKLNELEGIRGSFIIRKQLIDQLKIEDGRAVYYTEEGAKNSVTGAGITIVFHEGRAVKIFIHGNPRGHLISKPKETNAEN